MRGHLGPHRPLTVGAGGRIFAPWEMPLGDAATVSYGSTEFWRIEGKLIALGGMKLIDAS